MFDISGVCDPDQLAALTPAELVDAVRACARAENAACARKLAVMAELFIRRTSLSAEDRELWWIDPDAAVTAELGAAQHITAGLASAQAHRGVALRDRLPKVFALFLAGQISDMLVRAIVWRTYLITDPAVMAAVDAELAAEISGWGAKSVAKTEIEIDALVARHDRDAVRTKKESVIEPAVEFGSPTDPPGFTTIWARLFAGDAAIAEQLMDQMAFSVCEDDPRNLEARRAAAITARLTGATTTTTLACRCGNETCPGTDHPAPTRDTTVYILTDPTPETSADQPDGDQADGDQADGDQDKAPDHRDEPAPRAKPAYIFGAGLTPTRLLAQMCDGARFRPVVHPGMSGPEPRYTPSRALAEFIRCRDLTCRFPGCDAPATLADIDHTVPYPLGPTHASNLKCLCRFHHLLKTFWTGASGWRDRQYPDGTVVWTAPTGHTYTTQPGSRLLFPALCAPTGILWTGDPPEPPLSDQRGSMMPKRRNTRAHNRARSIKAERRRNRHLRQPPPPRSDTPRESATRWREPDYGDDPPPF
ncbi:HNH endonuclease signature motif containing protein [Mycolicibacterium vaccae]|uniref:HNH nuclease domain-containing protein n=1 Tax=Mycolicibacterium vaccae ATCC 25954 TaxID=1194972 RepID=K0VKY5_MYCVA|nr:HNH endonuclease signature motif containing protein [Mycolicibacterium vaccae]ANI38464.1 hypothetical protein MYVA_1244 [Mycolicibacterium vaccae 95051]EJZ11774.1 hypothetical protein MVAC_04347 [Mycolicibacterium vaccae ATCC 25954]